MKTDFHHSGEKYWHDKVYLNLYLVYGLFCRLISNTLGALKAQYGQYN